MLIGGEKLARSHIPEPNAVIGASCQGSSTIRDKRHRVNRALMGKGGHQLARGCIPKLGGFVPARCQDPSTVWTKRRVDDRVLMYKGGHNRRRHPFTTSD